MLVKTKLPTADFNCLLKELLEVVGVHTLALRDVRNDLAGDISIDFTAVKVIELGGLLALDNLIPSIELKVALAESNNGGVVNIGESAAHDTLVRRQASEFGAVLIEIGLEVVVDSLLHGLGEPLLSLGVAITEVVALAAGDKVEAGRAVGRLGAVVRSPDAFGRVPGIARLLEGCHGSLEEKVVGGLGSASSCAAL